MIPYGRQDIDASDVQAVIRQLTSDYLTQGPTVPAFEQAVATRCKTKHAVAVTNATAALHIACLALGLGPGDRLWTSPISFVASANCGLYCGAQVDFVDIDPASYNMCPKALEAKLVAAEMNGTLPKIVVAVHMAGQSCDMASISVLAKKYGFAVIEDASHAIGGLHDGEPIGCGRHSDITVFSFHPVKIITTGEGGMALTRCAETAHRMRLLRSHGITRDEDKMTEVSHGLWHYQQISLGFNYRMTDLQAALGLSQLTRIDAFLEKRRRLADRYNLVLQTNKLPIICPWQHPGTLSSWHLYIIQINGLLASATRREVFDHLRNDGILVNVHYIPIHTQPWYQRLGFKKGDFPVAEAYYTQAISLPLHTQLTDTQQDQVIHSLERALQA